MIFSKLGFQGGFGSFGALGLARIPNLLPNSRMNNAEVTDNTELLTNWNFPTDLSGWTATQTGTSTIAWASAQHVTFTFNSTSDSLRLDQSFSMIQGHTYTIRTAYNSITTVAMAMDIGTTQGGFNILNGAGLGVGASYFTFIAPSTGLCWVRNRPRTAAGTASLYSISAMIGGVPPDWKTGGASTARDVEIYMRVVGLGTATDIPGIASAPTMDVRHFGTSGAGGTITMSFHMNSQGAIPSNNGDVRTGTIFNELIAGGITGYGSILLSIYPSNGSSNLNPAISPQKQLTMGAGWTRDQTSGALNNAATVSCFESIEYTVLASQTVDSTIRIAVPMVAAGSIPGAPRLTP